MTYLWLSLAFLVIAGIVLTGALMSVSSRRALVKRWWLSIVATGVAVMILTTVFDNVMISAGLMTYAPTEIFGAFIGLAPVEDFAYPLAALILLPSLWILFGKRDTHGR